MTSKSISQSCRGLRPAAKKLISKAKLVFILNLLAPDSRKGTNCSVIIGPRCCCRQYIYYFDTRNKLQHFLEPQSESCWSEVKRKRKIEIFPFQQIGRVRDKQFCCFLVVACKKDFIFIQCCGISIFVPKPFFSLQLKHYINLQVYLSSLHDAMLY